MSAPSWAGALYSSDVSATLSYEVSQGDEADLDVLGETALFFYDATTSGNATANATGSPDTPFLASPL